jgi:hypothetical protein
MYFVVSGRFLSLLYPTTSKNLFHQQEDTHFQSLGHSGLQHRFCSVSWAHSVNCPTLAHVASPAGMSHSTPCSNTNSLPRYVTRCILQGILGITLVNQLPHIKPIRDAAPQAGLAHTLAFALAQTNCTCCVSCYEM